MHGATGGSRQSKASQPFRQQVRFVCRRGREGRQVREVRHREGTAAGGLALHAASPCPALGRRCRLCIQSAIRGDRLDWGRGGAPPRPDRGRRSGLNGRSGSGCGRTGSANSRWHFDRSLQLFDKGLAARGVCVRSGRNRLWANRDLSVFVTGSIPDSEPTHPAA